MNRRRFLRVALGLLWLPVLAVVGGGFGPTVKGAAEMDRRTAKLVQESREDLATRQPEEPAALPYAFEMAGLGGFHADWQQAPREGWKTAIRPFGFPLRSLHSHGIWLPYMEAWGCKKDVCIQEGK